jgi:hypothetical protein
VRDITKRKQAEEEIKNLAKFPAGNPNPVLRIKNDGSIQFANQASGPILSALKSKTGRFSSAEWKKMIRNIYDSSKSSELELIKP